MKIQVLAFLITWAFLAVSLLGCSSLHVPRYGSGTVEIIEGGLVETIEFEGGESLNIQITKEHVPGYKYLAQHVLTIGKFSPIIGSGFSRRSNIYYESIIGDQGHDTFNAGNIQYNVLWKEIEVIPGHKNNTTSIYSVTIKQLEY